MAKVVNLGTVPFDPDDFMGSLAKCFERVAEFKAERDKQEQEPADGADNEG